MGIRTALSTGFHGMVAIRKMQSRCDTVTKRKNTKRRPHPQTRTRPHKTPQHYGYANGFSLKKALGEIEMNVKIEQVHPRHVPCEHVFLNHCPNRKFDLLVFRNLDTAVSVCEFVNYLGRNGIDNVAVTASCDDVPRGIVRPRESVRKPIGSSVIFHPDFKWSVMSEVPAENGYEKIEFSDFAQWNPNRNGRIYQRGFQSGDFNVDVFFKVVLIVVHNGMVSLKFKH